MFGKDSAFFDYSWLLAKKMREKRKDCGRQLWISTFLSIFVPKSIFMKKALFFALTALLLLIAAGEGNRKPTVFMIGDSTMANKSIKDGAPERGWGMMLPGFLTEDIVVDNHAVNGRSSKSFIDEGRWDAVLKKMMPGDYVVIQFGHNDEKPKEDRHTDPGTTFDANLRRFCTETLERGATPILMNAIVRRNFKAPADSVVSTDDRLQLSEVDESGEGLILYDTHGAYLDSPRNVAKELGVPFVDANRITHELVQGMGRDESKKLFMHVSPKTVWAVPDGRIDNTHLNVYGGRVVAGLLVDAIAETVPALKPFVRHYDFVVAKDGSGDFFTLQEAINAVPDFCKNHRTTILLRAGEYDEKVNIPPSKINVSLIGQEGAVITGSDYASKKNVLGDDYSTSGSASCYIWAPDFYCEGVTFSNTAGPVGQAVACFIGADRVVFNRCRFLGYQDTLYNWAHRSRQYFRDCYVEGTVDFIFGWSTAVFDRCTIHSIGDGYLTAPSTDKGDGMGYVFHDCVLTGSEGVKAYLGRPWREYARAAFIRCRMDSHIRPEGWHNWGKPEAEKHSFFAEYGSQGAGANGKTRVKWAHTLKEKDLKRYETSVVLAGSDGWNPLSLFSLKD